MHQSIIYIDLPNTYFHSFQKSCNTDRALCRYFHNLRPRLNIKPLQYQIWSTSDTPPTPGPAHPYMSTRTSNGSDYYSESLRTLSATHDLSAGPLIFQTLALTKFVFTPTDWQSMLSDNYHPITRRLTGQIVQTRHEGLHIGIHHSRSSRVALCEMGWIWHERRFRMPFLMWLDICR